MRFITQAAGSVGLDPGPGRPPLDRLPTELAALLTERDRAREKLYAAEQQQAHLLEAERDAEAERTDDEAAAAAARAGKKIPPAAATAKLAADRAEALRTVQAHRTALAQVTNDVLGIRTANPDAAEAKAALREKIATAAAELATAVEDAVAACAVDDWLAGRGYYPRAETWVVEIEPNLAAAMMDRNTSPRRPVREYITAAATTVLED